MARADDDSGLDENGESPFPDARRPDRAYDLPAHGVRIAVHEWGDADAPPLMMMHGGFDFARTFDLFAPKLAAGGWRVVCWDQRGHGNSEHAPLYSWDGDMRDTLAVFDHVAAGRPIPVVGHSKGGALMTQLADAQPHRFRCLVNMDGIPYKRNIPDLAEHERTTMLAKDLAGWLDHRRRTATASRKPGTLDELARRRGRMNPRLPHEWLRRLVTTGGFESDDGWRWKIDPALRFGGFGPWRPEWTLMRLPGLPMPFLGVLGGQMEEMGWGTPPHKVAPYMPIDGRCEVLDDVGHFVHIEQPDLVSELILDFIGDPA
jgi:pimeloyl-ACP methyl ester carboxylesterase